MEKTYKKIELIYSDGNTPDEKHTRATAKMLEYLFKRLTNLSTEKKTVYKSLNAYLMDASIFIGTFNKRPDADLYYSEKTLTNDEKNDYEQAIKELLFAFERIL